MSKQSKMLYLFKFSNVYSPKVFGLFYNVYTFAALLTLLFGVMLSLMSAGVLGIWVGAEVGFLGGVCLLSGLYVSESESTMKYFIVQVVGSGFLILGLLMLVYCHFCFMASVLSVLGLSIKLGIFPFHFWVPSVMSGLSWSSCFVVAVVQKVAPLWLLSNLHLSGEEMSIMELLCSVTCFLGCLGGVGMMSYRALLGYSSLAHLGFIGVICLAGVWEFWWYLVVYGVLNMGLMWSLWMVGIYSYSDLLKEGGISYYSSLWWMAIYFFSLAGVPPFSGFFLKVYFLIMCWKLFPLGCVVCIISSVFSVYYYLSIFIDVSVFWGKSAGSMFYWGGEQGGLYLMVVSGLINLVFSYPLFLSMGV